MKIVDNKNKISEERINLHAMIISIVGMVAFAIMKGMEAMKYIEKNGISDEASSTYSSVLALMTIILGAVLFFGVSFIGKKINNGYK